PVLHKPRRPFLVFREVEIKRYSSGYQSAEAQSPAVQKNPFIISCFFRLLLLDNRVNRQKKILFVYLEEICGTGIKSVPPGFFTPESSAIAIIPFYIVD